MIQNTSRYVFFGSPRFAEIILEKLIAGGVPPVAVVTNPDKPFGRKKILTPPPVKVLAKKNNIKVFQPAKIDVDFISEMQKLEPELAVIAAYSKIVPNELISVPKYGAIGIHPSLLPKYRGASPIQGALLEGETITGVTLYKVDEKVDHGPIYAQSEAKIEPADGYLELEANLAELGARMFIEILPKFSAGEIVAKEQDHSFATLTKKFKTEDGFIAAENLAQAMSGENSSEAEHILGMIRALNPDPGTWTLKNNKRIKLLKARLNEKKLELITIQIEGKTPVAYRADLLS